MSGYPYGGNPQYPPPQNPIYPQLYNPTNAPPPMQPGLPGYPAPGQNPQYAYQPGQPGFAYPYMQPGQPAQPGHLAAMSYPGVQSTPTAPSAPAYGYPGAPTVTPQSAPASVEWVPTTPQQAHALSHKAVIGGYEGHDGSPLWVIRANFEGDLIPGKMPIKHQVAYVPWDGKENRVDHVEVCCARPETIRWVPSNNGMIPQNAVIGGRTYSAEPLYIGRAKHQGSLTPGKVHPSHKVLYISFAGDELPHKEYEVLCTA